MGARVQATHHLHPTSLQSTQPRQSQRNASDTRTRRTYKEGKTSGKADTDTEIQHTSRSTTMPIRDAVDKRVHRPRKRKNEQIPLYVVQGVSTFPYLTQEVF